MPHSLKFRKKKYTKHSLQLGTASGPDQIQPEHLRYTGFPPSLFNLIVNTEYILSNFQQGLIIPIPKSLDKDPL